MVPHDKLTFNRLCGFKSDRSVSFAHMERRQAWGKKKERTAGEIGMHHGCMDAAVQLVAIQFIIHNICH